MLCWMKRNHRRLLALRGRRLDETNGVRGGWIHLRTIVPIMIALVGGSVAGAGTTAVTSAERFSRLETLVDFMRQDTTQKMLSYQGIINSLNEDRLTRSREREADLVALEKRLTKIEARLDVITETLNAGKGRR